MKDTAMVLQTPPRPTRTRSIGLHTPSTPHRLSGYSKAPQQCPDAPFLPVNLFPFPTPLRTSPRTKRGDPTKVSQMRTRTATADRGTVIQPGMPPTPAETPVQKRRREQEMRRRIETPANDTTKRQLFPMKTVMEDAVPAPSFEIFTDTMHRTPVTSPNNPFAFDSPPKQIKGISPKKRKAGPEKQQLGPHEMWYNFRGKRIVRKVAPGPNGESWRDAVKPVRLFQTEIEEAARRRKRRRIIKEDDIEEVDTEEEGHSGDEVDGMDC